MSGPGWETLGSCAPADLGQARLQLHHAAQIVAAVGGTLLEPRPDDSHPNLGWLTDIGALAGHSIPGDRPFRAALQLAELRLLLLGADGDVMTSLVLSGETCAAGAAWLAREIEARFGLQLEEGLKLPGYDLPRHAVQEGAPFEATGEAFAELARYYAAAHAELGAIAGRTEAASDVRCWPHHFDLATLVTVETAEDGSAAKTIGLGLSPGDGSYAEPYWYVSPWPYPDAARALAPLASGAHWHREGFTAAILTSSAWLAGGPDADQPTRLRDFLDGAAAASRSALGV